MHQRSPPTPAQLPKAKPSANGVKAAAIANPGQSNKDARIRRVGEAWETLLKNGVMGIYRGSFIKQRIPMSLLVTSAKSRKATLFKSHLYYFSELNQHQESQLIQRPAKPYVRNLLTTYPTTGAFEGRTGWGTSCLTI